MGAAQSRGPDQRLATIHAEDRRERLEPDVGLRRVGDDIEAAPLQARSHELPGEPLLSPVSAKRSNTTRRPSRRSTVERGDGPLQGTHESSCSTAERGVTVAWRGWPIWRSARSSPAGRGPASARLGRHGQYLAVSLLHDRLQHAARRSCARAGTARRSDGSRGGRRDEQAGTTEASSRTRQRKGVVAHIRKRTIAGSVFCRMKTVMIPPPRRRRHPNRMVHSPSAGPSIRPSPA